MYRAVKLTLKAKLRANVDFIFGLPHETTEDIKLTINVMEDLAKMGARIHAHSFMPLPMTPFAREPARRLDERIQESLKSSILGSSVFGEWKKQEELALKIARFLQTRELN